MYLIFQYMLAYHHPIGFEYTEVKEIRILMDYAKIMIIFIFVEKLFTD